ncbi:hypothetical protein C8R45DRAFT_1209141 [Mycena sanguinolenta]|nr:hypothetical protein C8R45DRAFT_1209141 [Mycena sanguinolenta]
MGDAPAGEFDQDEDTSTIAAARAAKRKETMATAKASATSAFGNRADISKWGFLFRTKLSRSQRARHQWQGKGGTQTSQALSKDTAVPEFQPTTENIWSTYFPAYPYTDAVQHLAVGALRNWRSDIGKRAVQFVTEAVASLPSLEAHRKWVADQLKNLAFLYRDPATKSGSYRSDLFVRTFGAHLRKVVLKIDVSDGHSVGAASVTCLHARFLYSRTALFPKILYHAGARKRRAVSVLFPGPTTQQAISHQSSP